MLAALFCACCIALSLAGSLSMHPSGAGTFFLSLLILRFKNARVGGWITSGLLDGQRHLVEV
jgi:hypothetical protein